MFKIDILATGSKGNAYTITDGDRRILIDPGIRFKTLQRKTGFKLSSFDFALVSHEHKDHCQSVTGLFKMGITCAMSSGTASELTCQRSFVQILTDGVTWSSHGWRVLPFDTVHDAAEPLGYLIESPSGKKICYATDTCYIKYDFVGVTHWMIEANYDDDLLTGNDELNEYLKARIRTSHFEIENVKRFFSNQDLSKTKGIYLIHLSENNSDAKRFKSEIEALTGKPVFTK